MNNYKTDVQSIQRKEKTMIGAKSSFRIIYDYNCGLLGRLLSKERILILSPTFLSHKQLDGRKRKRGPREFCWELQQRSEVYVLYLGCFSLSIYHRYTTEVNNSQLTAPFFSFQKLFKRKFNIELKYQIFPLCF